MAIRLRTTNTNVLADALCRSSATVKTEFTRLFSLRVSAESVIWQRCKVLLPTIESA